MKDYIDITKPKSGQHILVDYFSGTFPFICYEDDLELAVMEDILNDFANFFNYTKEIISKKLNFNIQEFDITLNTFKKVV